MRGRHMQSINEVYQALERLKKNLTPKQVAFLDARVNTHTDKAALEKAGVTRQAVSGWKRQVDFMQAYTLVVQVISKDSEVLVLADMDRQELVEQQLRAIKAVMPRIVKTHIQIALTGAKDSDRLRAIEKLYELVGLDENPANRIPTQNKVLHTMLQLIAPQLIMEATKRGVTVDPALREIVEGQFQELQDWGKEDDSGSETEGSDE